MTNKKLKKRLTNPFNCAIVIYDEMKKVALILRLPSHENNLSRYISVCVHII